MTEYRDADYQRLRPYPTELTDRVSGSFENMNFISTRVGSRGSRHLARSFNLNTDEELSEPRPLGRENPVHYGSRGSRHLARSINANTNIEDDVNERLLNDRDSSVHYDSIYDSEEYGSQRNGIAFMRKRLKAHFMNPYEKFKKRGRKPWKLFIQMLKIFLVTAQVVIFGQELFSVVTYMENSLNTFKHLFILDYSDDGVFIFTKEHYYKQVQHTVFQYYTIRQTPVGIYIPTIQSDNLSRPLQLCKYEYQEGFIDPGNHTYIFNRNTNWLCQKLLPPIHSDANLTSFRIRNNITQDFDRSIKISITAAGIRSLHLKDDPECYEFNITITFDNSNHDGKIPVDLIAQASKCKNTGFQDDDIAVRNVYVAVDAAVILVCIGSLALCIRSLGKHFKLVKATRRFFRQELHDHLSYWDCLDLINLWFILIVISDTCTILGSIFKILIDSKKQQMTTVLSMYNTCSIFLGTGVLFTWIGVLRYLGYMKKYNILLVTLRASGPSVLRFCVCAALLYFGFMFCGWIVLGPYHPKFRNLSTVSECLFSLINGDDMYMTYSEMQKRNIYIWVFSKIYLYVFISLFIYVVLSLFIGIISDTYERIKDWGHPPCTKIQRFVHGPNCQRCAEEYRDDENDGNRCGSTVEQIDD
ncbi:mucolipin-3-like [Actinia tenebrosa]|uniref:Mucolipin-3-like n=1 Tax=Actinia tenebrosa TaxID=6105 RepID=A0A6P8HEY7_ACTTE|nr:mucolipin-3-like [Actinia tenebrosa]